MPARDETDRWSAMCWDGKHERCTGWLVVPDHSLLDASEGQSLRCECDTCEHPSVDKGRHFKERPTPLAAFGTK